MALLTDILLLPPDNGSVVYLANMHPKTLYELEFIMENLGDISSGRIHTISDIGWSKNNFGVCRCVSINNYFIETCEYSYADDWHSCVKIWILDWQNI